MTTDAKTGNVTTEVKNASGTDTTTVKDKHGKVVSTTTTTPDGQGGYTSVTKDKHGNVTSTSTKTPERTGGYTVVTKDKNGKVLSTTTDDSHGKVVTGTGQKQMMLTTGTSGKSKGGTGTSGIGGLQKTNQKLQSEVVRVDKTTSNLQGMGSSSAPSGSSHPHFIRRR